MKLHVVVFPLGEDPGVPFMRVLMMVYDADIGILGLGNSTYMKVIEFL